MKVALVLMGIVLLAACTAEPAGQTATVQEPDRGIPEQVAERTESVREPVYQKAPDFEVATITGEQVSMEAYRNDDKPLLVYFTASWCPVCAKNWPALSEVYPEYEDRVNFVSISIDPTDTKEILTELAAEKGINYPLVPGNPQIMLDFGVKSQATTVGVDRGGNIVFVKEKQVISKDEYRALLDQLLADG